MWSSIIVPGVPIGVAPTLAVPFSDASGTAASDYCLQSGLWWRYDLSDEESSQFKCATARSDDDISINVLELLGMVVSACVIFVLRGDDHAVQ